MELASAATDYTVELPTAVAMGAAYLPQALVPYRLSRCS